MSNFKNKLVVEEPIATKRLGSKKGIITLFIILIILIFLVIFLILQKEGIVKL